MKKICLLLAVLVMTQPVCFADNSVGCGLGSMIFKKRSLVSATSRVITNQVFLTQYLGTTTGTSGCTQHSIVQTEMAPVYYAEANIENLKVDIAIGEGQYIDAFATTLGCDAAIIPTVRRVTQENYSDIFRTSRTSPYEMLNNVKRSLNNSEQTRGKCKFVLI
ncbi:MAG: DUF3015 family protein [Bacteriovoracaceae bacterium]|nr:DUF3015 family protein [Bacteriovoracaceae bacterium]